MLLKTPSLLESGFFYPRYPQTRISFSSEIPLNFAQMHIIIILKTTPRLRNIRHVRTKTRTTSAKH